MLQSFSVSSKTWETWALGVNGQTVFWIWVHIPQMVFDPTFCQNPLLYALQSYKSYIKSSVITNRKSTMGFPTNEICSVTLLVVTKATKVWLETRIWRFCEQNFYWVCKKVNLPLLCFGQWTCFSASGADFDPVTRALPVDSAGGSAPLDHHYRLVLRTLRGPPLFSTLCSL